VKFLIDGHEAHAATGGRAHRDGQRLAVFIHGAGLDHTVWALQSRWLAFRGWNVLAADLPGHGRSGGTPLPTIGAMADWIHALVAAVGAPGVALVGHSMGSLVALEAAACAPERVEALLLIGTAATMPVHPDLLAAAAANSQDAIDMVNLWGYGYRAGLGGSAAPGVWMTGAGDSLLRRARPGVLHSDLAACNAYTTALEAAARVRAPTAIVAGELDQMTPLKNARLLANAIAGSALTVLPGAGHMLLAEEPDALLEVMGAHLVRQAPPAR
jgi:pimeloyl-ACP methyl ester carboxylesterase